VALSTTADSNNWSAVIEGCRESNPASGKTPLDYQRSGPIRQRQRRLTETQVSDLAARYEEGATVYELAAEFGCNRATVAERLKRAGISLRLQSPTDEVVDQMVILYESGSDAPERWRASRVQFGNGAKLPQAAKCLDSRHSRARSLRISPSM
jgi:hypothetical protein